MYVRFLMFMSWYLFLQEGVDVVVYEIGIGGEFDVINLVEKFVVIGIIMLGIDYVFVLGNMIEKIVWYKVGIMKIGSLVFIVL